MQADDLLMTGLRFRADVQAAGCRGGGVVCVVCVVCRGGKCTGGCYTPMASLALDCRPAAGQTERGGGGRGRERRGEEDEKWRKRLNLNNLSMWIM